MWRILIGDKSLHNKGIGKQVLKAMVNAIFSTTDHEAIDLSVFDWNHNAINCYQQIGFVIRPGLETAMQVDGQIWKAHNMILLKSQYYKDTND